MKTSPRAHSFGKWILFAALPAAIIGQFIVSCDSSTAPSTPYVFPARYFKDSVEVIFKSNCVSCHVSGGFGWQGTGADTAGGLDLTTNNAYASLVGKASFEHRTTAAVPALRVSTDSNSANSYLYHKVSMVTPESGSRMPLGGQLTAAQIAVIKKWIDNGAPLGDTTTVTTP